MGEVGGRLARELVLRVCDLVVMARAASDDKRRRQRQNDETPDFLRHQNVS